MNTFNPLTAIKCSNGISLYWCLLYSWKIWASDWRKRFPTYKIKLKKSKTWFSCRFYNEATKKSWSWFLTWLKACLATSTSWLLQFTNLIKITPILDKNLSSGKNSRAIMTLRMRLINYASGDCRKIWCWISWLKFSLKPKFKLLNLKKKK